MLKRIYRITKAEDYRRIYRQGSKIYNPFFILRCLSNQKSVGRFGVIISKKVAKKAVLRNRLKRQITEIIRLTRPGVLSGYDCSLICLPRVKEADYATLRRNWGKILDKMHHVKNH